MCSYAYHRFSIDHGTPSYQPHRRLKKLRMVWYVVFNVSQDTAMLRIGFIFDGIYPALQILYNQSTPSLPFCSLYIQLG